MSIDLWAGLRCKHIDRVYYAGSKQLAAASIHACTVSCTYVICDAWKSSNDLKFVSCTNSCEFTFFALRLARSISGGRNDWHSRVLPAMGLDLTSSIDRRKINVT